MPIIPIIQPVYYSETFYTEYFHCIPILWNVNNLNELTVSRQLFTLNVRNIAHFPSIHIHALFCGRVGGCKRSLPFPASFENFIEMERWPELYIGGGESHCTAW